jgi:hypothetical protein
MGKSVRVKRESAGTILWLFRLCVWSRATSAVVLPGIGSLTIAIRLWSIGCAGRAACAICVFL